MYTRMCVFYVYIMYVCESTCADIGYLCHPIVLCICSVVFYGHQLAQRLCKGL